MSVLDWLLLHQNRLLWGALIFAGGACAIWESLWPRRQWRLPVAARLTTNAALRLLNGAVLALLLPLSAAAFAVTCSIRGWGLLNLAQLSGAAGFLVSLLALSLLAYLVHRALHASALLWRVHRVHHCDLDVDFSTGLRHHPLEVIAMSLAQLACIAILGIDAAALIVFWTLETAAAMFTHANVHISARWDKYLRLALVTPDMHRIHHSTDALESNRNFGTLVPWWDLLFSTYQREPAHGNTQMSVGVADLRTPGELGLVHLLLLPFQRGPRASHPAEAPR
jgi:sterol desaturase/sphingolipid hydroxylase (fatty acid hydroxylase superfamily)